MQIIDAHAHVYADTDTNYPPVEKPIRPPGKSGAFSALESLTKENNVAGVCVVQPGTFYGWDNRFICDISKASPKRIAGVCSLDPDDSNSYEKLNRCVRDYGVRGLRSFPASDGHLDHGGVQELWRAAGELGVVVNVLIKREQADELARMLEKFPQQPVVIDHCFLTKPGLELSDTVDAMLRLAKFPNSYAKLTFLPLGSTEEYPFRDMHGPCKRIIAGYGPDRCVWGSDFPCELWTPKTNYAKNLRLFTHELNLENAAKEAILGRTAHNLWFRNEL